MIFRGLVHLAQIERARLVVDKNSKDRFFSFCISHSKQNAVPIQDVYPIRKNQNIYSLGKAAVLAKVYEKRRCWSADSWTGDTKTVFYYSPLTLSLSIRSLDLAMP